MRYLQPPSSRNSAPRQPVCHHTPRHLFAGTGSAVSVCDKRPPALWVSWWRARLSCLRGRSTADLPKARKSVRNARKHMGHLDYRPRDHADTRKRGQEQMQRCFSALGGPPSIFITCLQLGEGCGGCEPAIASLEECPPNIMSPRRSFRWKWRGRGILQACRDVIPMSCEPSFKH